MDIKTYEAEHGISPREAITAIKREYPGFDKVLHGKAARSDYYGVRLAEGAEKLLKGLGADTNEKPARRERRKNPCRCQVRLSKKLYGQLQQALKRNGITTMQDGLTHIIIKWVEDQK